MVQKGNTRVERMIEALKLQNVDVKFSEALAQKNMNDFGFNGKKIVEINGKRYIQEEMINVDEDIEDDDTFSDEEEDFDLPDDVFGEYLQGQIPGEKEIPVHDLPIAMERRGNEFIRAWLEDAAATEAWPEENKSALALSILVGTPYAQIFCIL
ncbi:unnamed protein product [Protopolystoma xenopodis]|uniref:Uncharacterized protein n=1 Tax=Protopolystoma xenopodis TaxID=117903 RepID=A0A448XPP2_9PLAT|nr:unnamed protein product [Protopolystoma xenopodis]